MWQVIVACRDITITQIITLGGTEERVCQRQNIWRSGDFDTWSLWGQWWLQNCGLSWLFLTVLWCMYICTKLLQSCPTLCHPLDCSLPGSSVHGISQARVLEWVAISSSRGSSWPRDQTHVSYFSCFGWWVLYHWRHLGSPVCKVQRTNWKAWMLESLQKGKSQSLYGYRNVYHLLLQSRYGRG